MFNNLKKVFYLALVSISASLQITLMLCQFIQWPTLGVYGIFILFTISIGLVLLGFKDFLVGGYVVGEVIITSMMLTASYKIIIYDNPQLAQYALWVLALLSLGLKFFYQQGFLFFKRIANYIINKTIQFPFVKYISDGAVVLAIFLIIYVPNPERIVALSFIGEQWHHLDFFIMSPGLSILHGGKPYVDVLSQYGIGIPQVLVGLTQWLGGFNYVNIVHIIIIWGVLYFIGMYLFLRHWLGNIFLSMVGVLIGIRLILCHFGVSPLAWIYPSTTPIRLCVDIFFFYCLWRSMKHETWWLIAAGISCGASIYLMTTTGIGLWIAYGFFLLCLIFNQKINARKIMLYSGCLVLPLGVALLLTWFTVGEHIWDKGFWQRWFEYIQYFSNGHAGGVLPYIESLKYRNYFPWIIGVIIPLGYILSSCYAFSWWWRSNRSIDLLVIISMAIYGLVQYSYYVVRSAQSSYYMVSLPIIWIGLFWLSKIIQSKSRSHQWIIITGCVFISIYGLWTNHNFISYPNVLSIVKNPLVDQRVITRFPDRQGYFNHQVKNIKAGDKVEINSLGNGNEEILTEDHFDNEEQLLDYYRHQTDFSEDIGLIRQFTRPGEKVALISSFETAILLGANRPPLFYNIPVVTSLPFTIRYWPPDAAHSRDFLQKTLRQLEETKPAYVFLSKVYLVDRIPTGYMTSHYNIVNIIAYIRQHYRPVIEGKYLVAMELK